MASVKTGEIADDYFKRRTVAKVAKIIAIDRCPRRKVVALRCSFVVGDEMTSNGTKLPLDNF